MLGSSFATILFLFLVLEGSKLAGVNTALASYILYLQSVIMGYNVLVHRELGIQLLLRVIEACLISSIA